MHCGVEESCGSAFRIDIADMLQENASLESLTKARMKSKSKPRSISRWLQPYNTIGHLRHLILSHSNGFTMEGFS
jgi:hypothetical protein